MNWLQKLAAWYDKPEIEATEESVGYDPAWGEHMGRVKYKPDTWSFGSRGYPSGTAPMPIPTKLYHATIAPDKILQEGFKNFPDPKDQTFGGHGKYVSLTTLKDAEIYAEALRELSLMAHGYYDWSDVDQIAVKFGMPPEKVGWLKETIERWAVERPDLPWSDRRKLFEFFSFAGTHGSKFPILAGTTDHLLKRMVEQNIQPKDIGIIEATIKQPLQWHSGVNIFSDVDMSPNYTYNSSENEWRIWDPSMVVAVRRIA